jgi:hypothetical protein
MPLPGISSPEIYNRVMRGRLLKFTLRLYASRLCPPMNSPDDHCLHVSCPVIVKGQLLLNEFQKAFDNIRIECCTAFIGQNPDDLILGHGLPVWAHRSQGIVDISDGMIWLTIFGSQPPLILG